MTITATTHRIVLEDQSEVFDLVLDDGENSIQISVGSEAGAAEIIAVLNNHAVDTLKKISVTTRY